MNRINQNPLNLIPLPAKRKNPNQNPIAPSPGWPRAKWKTWQQEVTLFELPLCHVHLIAMSCSLRTCFVSWRAHSTKKPVTTMLTYPWKCTVLHCNHLGNTWKPLVLMTRHFDYCPSASEGDNQSVRSSAPVVSRCFPGGSNVKLYISRGRLAWWLLAFLAQWWCIASSTLMRFDFLCAM